MKNPLNPLNRDKMIIGHRTFREDQQGVVRA